MLPLGKDLFFRELLRLTEAFLLCALVLWTMDRRPLPGSRFLVWHDNTMRSPDPSCCSFWLSFIISWLITSVAMLELAALRWGLVIEKLFLIKGEWTETDPNPLPYIIGAPWKPGRAPPSDFRSNLPGDEDLCTVVSEPCHPRLYLGFLRA